jgi:hypothetical protein
MILCHLIFVGRPARRLAAALYTDTGMRGLYELQEDDTGFTVT